MPMFLLNSTEKKALNQFSTRIKNNLGLNLLDLRIFGSKSTGKFRDESDIDVLIVVNNRNDEVLDVISEILLDVELKYDSKISPVVLTTTELLKNQQHQTLFYHEVIRDGITL